MSRVEIIGPKSRFFEVMALLHEQGKMHIEDLSKKIHAGEVPLDQMEIASGQQAEQESMDDLLIRVRAIIRALHLPGNHMDEAKRQKEYLRLWKQDSDELAQEISHAISEVEDKTSGLAQSQTDIESELALLARYEPILHKIQPLAKQIVTTGAFESVALLIERRYKGALEQLKEELYQITKKQCEIVSTDVDEDTTAAIVVFNRAYSEPVHKFLAMEDVNQIRLPSDLQGMPFDAAYETIRERRRVLPQQLEDVRKELEIMSGKWYLRFATIRDVLVDKLAEISAIPKFGQTEYAFVITGWIPADDLPDLRRSVRSAFGEDIILNQMEISEDEYAETPVALRNPKAVAPFETLFPMLAGGMPRYGTVDPTTILAVFYPLFFGMIVGDIGYGTIYLGLTLFLRFRYRDKPMVQLATSILGPAATMAIVWGFIYGELFGSVLEHLKVIVPVNVLGLQFPIERTKPEMLLFMILLALGVGVTQIVYGLVLGIINGIKTKHVSHVWEKGGMLSVLGGALILGIAAIPALAVGKTAIQIVGALLLIVGVVYATRGGKAVGMIESLLQFSHIASYIRIMAVGLAGAIFANAINVLVLKMGWVVGGLIGLILHALNLLLSAFSPNIHALRLNFLEFFGKFYEAGQEEYKPFTKTGGEKSA